MSKLVLSVAAVLVLASNAAQARDSYGAQRIYGNWESGRPIGTYPNANSAATNYYQPPVPAEPAFEGTPVQKPVYYNPDVRTPRQAASSVDAQSTTTIQSGNRTIVKSGASSSSYSQGSTKVNRTWQPVTITGRDDADENARIRDHFQDRNGKWGNY